MNSLTQAQEEKLAEFRSLQERLDADGKIDGKLPCPRCGKYTMQPCLLRNALSRRVAGLGANSQRANSQSANIYICDSCGQAEALSDYLGEEDPVSEWAIMQ